MGDIGVISFYPNKQITTGEGGLVITNSKRIADICRSMKNQGRDPGSDTAYPFVRLGYNYRLSDINCALGIAQFERLEEILAKRKSVAEEYTKLLKDIKSIKIPCVAPDVKLSWFVYVVQLNDNYTNKDRDILINKMAQKGVACSNYFPPIHLQPFYRKMFGFKPGDFPVTEKVSERTIALPFYNNLSLDNIEKTVSSLKSILKKVILL